MSRSAFPEWSILRYIVGHPVQQENPMGLRLIRLASHDMKRRAIAILLIFAISLPVGAAEGQPEPSAAKEGSSFQARGRDGTHSAEPFQALAGRKSQKLAAGRI